MVFSGEKREPSDEEMERLKPLHNFDLPCLKWGNQKLLRCMNVDSNADVSTRDRTSGNRSTSVMTSRQSDRKFRFRFGSSNDYKFSSSEKMKAVSGTVAGAGDGEIEATREKLMFDFQTEVGKMKDAILRGSLADPPSVPSPAPATEPPWNLRTRRAACKSPARNGDDRKPNFSPARNGDDRKPNFSPARNECEKSPVTGEKRERPKFSVSLSRRELEEDFTEMTGRKLPRKPKKRPRVIQKQLDTLFPGLWLSEITADLYRVPDDTETGKR